MAAVTILTRAAKQAVFDTLDGSVKAKSFRLHIASTANGGAALEQNSVIRAVKLPKGAILQDIHMRWEAGSGTNTLAVRRTAVSDGVTHTDIKTGLVGGSAGYWRLSDETAGAETCRPTPLAVESWIDIECAGANGWPVDKYIEGTVFYVMPTFDDEIEDVAGTAEDDLGV
jgi:hypothetical protein